MKYQNDGGGEVSLPTIEEWLTVIRHRMPNEK
jgi:hypothetical protein